jgi:O-antigen biosynthesis protein
LKKKLKPLKKPSKLGFLTYVGDTQGCGTIRVIYPYFLLNHQRTKNLMVHSTYLMNYVTDLEWYKPFTFVQFQRSATEQHLQLIQHFKNTIQKRYPIPCIYEIDDMLFGIPKWNYASLYYNQAEDLIKKIMESCDGMITSTAKLKEIYSPYCKKISVIPNHLPKFVWGETYPVHQYCDENSKIKILWGGSQNHFAMTEVVGEENKGGDFGKGLLNFIRKTTDKYEFHFMGAIPEELQDIKNKLKFHPWKSIFEYPKALKDIEPDICLAPLVDVEFNHCKSNIKCLEYTATGSVGVYSDVTPYKFQNLRAKTDEEFIFYIEKLASDIDFRAKTFNRDYQRVKSQLFWEENLNIQKYISTYLNMFGQCL